MTHEMGHNIGSPHTHNCVWGPNKNTSIDNCTIPDDGTSCTQGPRPTNGGTIMSYCHLVNGVGINFTKGFGPEPGQLMRDAITSKSCLSRTVNPTVKSSIAGPFYEGDSVRLRANPFLGNYTYDWFHYDVLLQGKMTQSLPPQLVVNIEWRYQRTAQNFLLHSMSKSIL